MNKLTFRLHGAQHPVLLNADEGEPLTLHTWEDLLSNKDIPNALLAIAALKTQNEKPLTKIYEATNLREHIKMAGLIDPLTRLPIEKINWVFMRTFNLDVNANIEYPNEYEFFPLDHLPDCFFEPMRSHADPEFPLEGIKHIFLQAFRMEKPLPHDWATSDSTKETIIQLQAEIFSRTCNPSLSREVRAQAQFIAGLSLLEELNRSPEPQTPLKKENGREGPPATHRTTRSDEGVRNWICAEGNGHSGSSAWLSMLYQGHCGLLPVLRNRQRIN